MMSMGPIKALCINCLLNLSTGMILSNKAVKKPAAPAATMLVLTISAQAFRSSALAVSPIMMP